MTAPRPRRGGRGRHGPTMTTPSQQLLAATTALALLLSAHLPDRALAQTPSTLGTNALEDPQTFLTDTICPGRPRTQCEIELDVPSACGGTPSSPSSCPIVFFLHGSGGTNDWFARQSGVHTENVIGIYPQGEGGWNTGPKDSNTCDWDDYDCTEDPDEGSLIAAIISSVRSLGGGGNVYVIGSSNGAALAHRLAANAGDDLPIKGIVTKVTQLLASPDRNGPGVLNYNQPSAGGPKVSVLNIMGTADGLIPYEGGASAVFGGDTSFVLMSAMDSMSTWAAHNGCSSTPTAQSTLTTDLGTGEAQFYVYGGCADGTIVEHYAIDGGGHSAGGQSVIGDVKIDYDIAYDFIRRVEAGGGPAPPMTPTTAAPVAAPVPSPVAAPTDGGSCVDDPTWAGKFNPDHTCDHIAQDPTVRCNWENSEGVKANDACKAACDPSCSAAPVQDPTQAPVPAPVPAPVAPPVPAPVAPPPTSPSCVDDPTWAGKFNPDHTCDHVALDPTVRCNWENSEGVKANDTCKVACSSCDGSGSAVRK